MQKPKVKVFNFGVYTAADFWRQIVEPDLATYRQQPCARTAMHLVHALWAVAEWLKEEGSGDVTVALQIVKDLSESGKHRVLQNEKRRARDFGHVYYGLAYGKAGAYGTAGGYSPAEPEVTLDNGNQLLFSAVVDDALKKLEPLIRPLL